MDVVMGEEEVVDVTSSAEGVAVVVSNGDNALQVEVIATRMVIVRIPVQNVKPGAPNITPKLLLQIGWGETRMVVSGMNDKSGIQIVLILITNVY